jgi:uncharacterized membrane protein YeaQ/YmgE (transglycosylase-associated protein family)
MHFTPGTLLIYLLIAAVAGSIGRAIGGGTRGGCLVSIALGFIGGIFGTWISRKAGLPEPLMIRLSGGLGSRSSGPSSDHSLRGDRRADLRRR